MQDQLEQKEENITEQINVSEFKKDLSEISPND